MTESTRDVQNSRDHNHTHLPVMHRDSNVAWCNVCGLDAYGKDPKPQFMTKEDKSIEEILTMVSEPSPILRFFEYRKLPSRMVHIGESFSVLAWEMETTLPNGVEKNVTLRKLLESRDAAIRAAL